jgi:hypothetical protein
MVSDDDKDLTPEERLSIMLALLADVDSPQGARPTLQEIQEWHAGRLDEKRAMEVKSHVARDPDCYQLWREIIAAEATVSEEAVKKQSWFIVLIARLKSSLSKPLPLVLGGGLTAALATMFIVLILPLLQTAWTPLGDPVDSGIAYNWPYQSMSRTRGGELSYQQKVALQYGIRLGIENRTYQNNEWTTAMTSLPDKLPTCGQSKDTTMCEQQNRLLKLTGINTGVMYLACLEYQSGKQQVFDQEYWHEQSQAWKKLSEQLAQAKLPRLEEIASSIYSQSDSRDAQCAAIRDVIYLSY